MFLGWFLPMYVKMFQELFVLIELLGFICQKLSLAKGMVYTGVVLH